MATRPPTPTSSSQRCERVSRALYLLSCIPSARSSLQCHATCPHIPSRRAPPRCGGGVSCMIVACRCKRARWRRFSAAARAGPAPTPSAPRRRAGTSTHSPWLVPPRSFPSVLARPCPSPPAALAFLSDLDMLTVVPPRSFPSVLARPVCHVPRSDHVASPCPVSPCLRVYVSTCVSLQVEKRTYRQQMGYATAHAHAAGAAMAPPATC